MPDQEPNDYVIPVVSEEVHTDAARIETGGVRVTKRTEIHEEVIQQEVRRGRVEVKRVPVNQSVPGPLKPRREGNTLIVPVVSEILRVEKQWILSEEIHLTQIQDSQLVTETVPLTQEVAHVERMDENGRVISEIAAPREHGRVRARAPENPEGTRKVLTSKNSSLVKKT